MVDDIGQNAMIICHSLVAERTRFFDDLFRQTKGQRVFQSGPNRGAAYTQIEIQLLIVIISFGGHDSLKNTRSNIMELEYRCHRK